MTKVSWWARAREGALSLLALTALVSILYVADYRLREGATRVVRDTSRSSVTQVSTLVTADASKMLRNARDRGAQHAALTGFVATAGVLLLFMLKT
jgi:hypothetical protein